MNTAHVLALALAFPACTTATGTDSPDDTARVAANFATGAPLLHARFGQLVTLEAIVLPVATGKGPAEPRLEVLTVDGHPTPQGLRMRWTYGGWIAEQEESVGNRGLLVHEGLTYRLRGYETGRWRGVPRGVEAMLADEWGPPQAKEFHFESVFRVLDGEALVPTDMPVLTDAAQIAAHEGRLVQLRGTLVGHKFTTLLDVSVASEPRSMIGAAVQAVGVLRRWNVPHDPDPWDSVAMRRGTFFSLVDPWRGGTAKVSPVDGK